MTDSDEARQRFAEDRSHQDALVANQSSRTTAQAAILINGGAATAILAFLAKDRIDPALVRSASWCLVGYALGVIAGAVMMFSATKATMWYSYSWRLKAHPSLDRDEKKVRGDAQWWLRAAEKCFLLSMLAFLVTSCMVGWLLFQSATR